MSSAVFLHPPIAISISSSCSVTPPSTSSSFCLVFTVSFRSLPSNFFFPVSPRLYSCQFSCPPCSLERQACVSPVYRVSGTFQLACIPASGCVGDKMELIPPGYCYLCFPPVTHKQTYTFTHTHKTQPHEHTL